MRAFVAAVSAVAPDATEGPITTLAAGDMILRSFVEAGVYALGSIAILLFIALRRASDVLLTLIPLALAGLVTMEIMAVFGMPFNFANIIALPLLLGVGVAFKIYYIMAWREGVTQPPPDAADARRHLQRADDRDSFRQPVAVEPSRHFEHGKAARAVATLHARRGGRVPADPDGKAPRGYR